MSEISAGDCGVCLGGYDCDDLDIDTYYERFVSIKKNCHCFECGALIPAGQEHEQCGGTYGDERKNWRFCLICSDISRSLSCEGRVFGTLWEDIENNLFPTMTTGCLAKLRTAAAKQHLVEQWREWKFADSGQGALDNSEQSG